MKRRKFCGYMAVSGAFLTGLAVFSPISPLLPPALAAEKGENTLIAYFSWSGNTRKVAEEIARLTGGKLLEIKPAKPYPADYDKVGAIAKKEHAENARPELAPDIPADIDEYETIFIGYPVWDHTMPMPVYSFLEKHKFADKKIIPFSTHMGSDLADGPEQIKKLCPDAKVYPGIAIRGNEVSGCADKLQNWLDSLTLMFLIDLTNELA